MAPKRSPNVAGSSAHPSGKGAQQRARRDHLVAVAADTERIFTEGCYQLEDGTEVNVLPLLEQAVQNSRHYPEAEAIPAPATPSPPHTTVFELYNATTLQATRLLVRQTPNEHVGVLNFASGKNPGGGWNTGALAQEETLGRASGLVRCLRRFDAEHYDANRKTSCGYYTDSLIFSPQVPVFKDDDGVYESTPYCVSFVTTPAVNAGVVRSREGGKGPSRGKPPAKKGKGDAESLDAIGERMTVRIERILRAFQYHGCTTLVLGAFGCGVFANDPHQVADIFKHLLRFKFKGAFRRIVFAILGEANLSPFAEVFNLHPMPLPTHATGAVPEPVASS